LIRVEDNRSLNAMANREDLHVAFTRHRATARMFVQDIEALKNRQPVDYRSGDSPRSGSDRTSKQN
jgi:hypothetical protein